MSPCDARSGGLCIAGSPTRRQTMFRNYVKTAFRDLSRNKLFALINIFGLSIGFLCTICILLFIHDELSYDKHHRKHRQIYRLHAIWAWEGGSQEIAKTGMALGPTLKEEYPQIVETVRMYRTRSNAEGTTIRPNLYTHEGRHIYSEDVWLVDPSIFDVFTHRFTSA